MKAVELLPARHDQFLAMISHLPHLAAAAKQTANAAKIRIRPPGTHPPSKEQI